MTVIQNNLIHPENNNFNKDDTSMMATKHSEKHVSIDMLPDKLLLRILSYLEMYDLLRIPLVCKRWGTLVRNPVLWHEISLRPQSDTGIEISDPGILVRLINERFGQLKSLELSTDLITANVLRELAEKCPKLEQLTLDFSSAMQLHDFNDLNAFPQRLRYLCIFLSDVIFMEGFMRKIYSYLTSIQTFHLIGTYENSEAREEETYEVINIHKIKTHTPNLRIVNFYGVKFLEDSHIESLSSTCIHLECLCLDFCTNFKGSALKILLKRSKKLTCLLMEKTGLTDENVKNAPWDLIKLKELDISSTELSGKVIASILPKLKHLRYFAASNLERLKNENFEKLLEVYPFEMIKALNLSWCQNVNEIALIKLLKRIGPNLLGLDISGLYDLSETFWNAVIPLLINCKILIIGIPSTCCLKIHSKVIIDKCLELMAQNCSHLEELEIQWDSDILRFSQTSNKFIDHLRTRCALMTSFAITEGEYYEMVKSNYERADRFHIVKSKNAYLTSLMPLLEHYKELCFA